MSDLNTQPTNLETLPPPSPAYVAEAEARSLNFLNPKLWQAMEKVAERFMHSGALPSSIKNAAQIIMVLQAGYEAGIQPLEAINSYYFVNGKLSLYGEMAINLVARAGHKIVWGRCDAESATVTITNKNTGSSMSNTFTMKQAQERGLDRGANGKKDPWAKHPENMLKFKVFHMTAKFVCPEAFHNVPIKEVLEDDEAGEVTVIPATTKPSKRTKNAKRVEEPVDDSALESELNEIGKTVEEKKPASTEEPSKKVEETDEQKAARLTEEELNGTIKNIDKIWLARHQVRTHS